MNITSRNINSRALVIVTVEINPNMYEMRQQVTKYNPMKKSQRYNHILTPISITAQDTKQNTFVPSSPCQRRLRNQLSTSIQTMHPMPLPPSEHSGKSVSQFIRKYTKYPGIGLSNGFVKWNTTVYPQANFSAKMVPMPR